MNNKIFSFDHSILQKVFSNSIAQRNFLCLLSIFTFNLSSAQSLKGVINKAVEWEYTSDKEYDNPFREVSLTATVTNTLTRKKVEISAFWAGDSIWKFRYSSPVKGNYKITTHCSDKNNRGLHNKKGSIVIEKYQGDNTIYANRTL